MKVSFFLKVLVTFLPAFALASQDIICEGLDHSQKLVQVRLENIRPHAEVVEGVSLKVPNKASEAVFSVATEKNSTRICESASVMGFVSKRMPHVASLDGSIYAECDGSGYRDQSSFKGLYWLNLTKTGNGQYVGALCGDGRRTIGGVHLNNDCVFDLACVAVSN